MNVKDKLRGKFEELAGRLTGDRKMQMKGKGRQVLGEVEQAGKAVAYDLEHEARREPSAPPPGSAPPAG